MRTTKSNISTLILAHRGCYRAGDKAGERENTMEGFLYALEMGAPGVELDVWVCASGEFVVHHDEFIEGLGSITDLSFGDIASARASIPTLNDVLETLNSTVINIEIKSSSQSKLGMPPALVVGEVASLVSGYRQKHKFVFSSFDKEIAREFPNLKMYGSSALLVGIGDHLGRAVDFCSSNGIDSIHLHWLRANRLARRLVFSAGLGLSIWGTDSPRHISRMLRVGATALITSNVEVAMAMTAS